MTLPARGGALTLEILVSLLLLGLLSAVGASIFSSQMRGARWVMETAEGQEAVRLSRWIVGSEVRAGLPGRDWKLDAGGVLRVRAFRGTAIACGPADTEGAVAVRYEGLRAPDPEKDSLLVLGLDGRWRATSVAATLSARGVGCGELPEGGRGRWVLSDDVGKWVLGRHFEAGTYHLADGSLRYRRGGEGRQPLVAERFGGASAFGREGSTLVVRIEVDPAPARPGGERGVRLWRIHPPEG